jgi:hypothetical protein
MLDVKSMPARVTDSEFHRRNILLAIPNRQSLGFVPFARLQDNLRCRTRTIFRQFNLDVNLALLLDEYLSPSAVIILFFTSIRVINNVKNGACDEECWPVISPDCSGTACCWSDRRRAAAKESPSDRISIPARSSS